MVYQLIDVSIPSEPELLLLDVGMANQGAIITSSFQVVVVVENLLDKSEANWYPTRVTP